MKLTKICKILGGIGTALVLTLSLLSSPNLASANTATTNLVSENVTILSTFTRYVEVEAEYFGKLEVPSTIYYDYKGYKGTLYLNSWKYGNDGKLIIAKYTGTVTFNCEGTCIAPSKQNEAQ